MQKMIYFIFLFAKVVVKILIFFSNRKIVGEKWRKRMDF